jgi:4-hydroxy-3-methylbut-2-en-1-yl diphosphate synthase IspG/GcpE
MLKLVCPHCGGTSFKVLSRAVDHIPMECLNCHQKLTIDISGGLDNGPRPQGGGSPEK